MRFTLAVEKQLSKKDLVAELRRIADAIDAESELYETYHILDSECRQIGVVEVEE